MSLGVTYTRKFPKMEGRWQKSQGMGYVWSKQYAKCKIKTWALKIPRMPKQKKFG